MRTTKFTKTQIDALLRWFSNQNIGLVNLDVVGEVTLPMINDTYIQECLEEGIL